MKRLIALLAVATLLTLMAASVDKVTAQTGFDPLEHFQCYKAKGETLNLTVSLQDQITNEPVVKVIKPAFICAPVNKNGEGFVTSAGANGKHLVCYKIKNKAKVEGIAGVTNLNPAFPPTQQLEVGGSKLLCVPVEKNFFSPGGDT